MAPGLCGCFSAGSRSYWSPRFRRIRAQGPERLTGKPSSPGRGCNGNGRMWVSQGAAQALCVPRAVQCPAPTKHIAIVISGSFTPEPGERLDSPFYISRNQGLEDLGGSEGPRIWVGQGAGGFGPRLLCLALIACTLARDWPFHRNQQRTFQRQGPGCWGRCQAGSGEGVRRWGGGGNCSHITCVWWVPEGRGEDR